MSDRPWLTNNSHPVPGGNRFAPRLPPVANARVLILSASIGTGHVHAARAIEEAVHQLAPDAEVTNADVLSLSMSVFRYCFAGMYLNFIHHAPILLSYIYNRMDRAAPSPSSWLNDLKITLEMLGVRPFLHLLESQPWDLVINTFFLPAELVGALRKSGRFHAPQTLVVTDFETHRNWAPSPCDLYFTATEESALYLQTFGVPASTCEVVGIPVHPKFAARKDRGACLARHGLKGDRPIIFQLSCGHGMGPVEKHYRQLLAIEMPLEIVVVTGNDTAARQRFNAIPVPERHRSQILGYSDRIDELMAVADLVVTKPGGLSVSEALAIGVPLVLTQPIPGQEERNCDFLLENGAALKINHVPTMAHKLESVLRDPARLAELRSHARRLGRPHAAFEIAARSLALIRPRQTQSVLREQRAAV